MQRRLVGQRTAERRNGPRIGLWVYGNGKTAQTLRPVCVERSFHQDAIAPRRGSRNRHNGSFSPYSMRYCENTLVPRRGALRNGQRVDPSMINLRLSCGGAAGQSPKRGRFGVAESGKNEEGGELCGLEKAEAACVGRGLAAVVYVKLAVDVVGVFLDRAGG